MLAEWQTVIIDCAGNPLKAAGLTVRLESTGTLAELFADSAGLEPLDNPVTAGDQDAGDQEDGFIHIYVAPGKYSMDATLAGFTRTWRNFQIGPASGAGAAPAPPVVVTTNPAYPPYHLFHYVPAAEIPAILNNTSTYDATDAFQAACDAACAVEGRPHVVHLPPGKINVTFIDLTNTRQANTLSRDGLIVQGSGQFATSINGAPGCNRAVIDISGAQGLQLRDMTISGVCGQVGVGVFTSSSTLLHQSHQQRFQKLYAALPGDAGANEGNGTIGFWNYGSEENVHDACYYEGDRAAIFSASPTAPFEYRGPVNPLSSAHSCGVNTLNGVSMIALTSGPVLITVDVGAFNFEGYLKGKDTGAGHLIQGALLSSSIDVIVEDVSVAIDVQGSIDQVDYVCNFATASAGECIRLRESAGIIGSTVRMYLGAATTKQLLRADVPSSAAPITTLIKNSQFISNLDKAQVLNGDIQFTGNRMSYVLANSSNVKFSAPGYEYEVYEDRHVLRVPRIAVPLTGGASPAVLPMIKAIIPADGIANQRGTAPVIEFNGSLSASAADPNSWGARIQAFLPFYSDFQTNAITLGGGAGSVLSKSVRSPASFDIASVTVTGTVSGNEVTASLSVARSGNQGTAVILRGTVTLWQDDTSVGATSLALL